MKREAVLAQTIMPTFDKWKYVWCCWFWLYLSFIKSVVTQLPDNCIGVPSDETNVMYVYCEGSLPDFSSLNFPHAPFVSEVHLTECTSNSIVKNTFQGLTAVDGIYILCPGNVTNRPYFQFDPGTLNPLQNMRFAVIQGVNITHLPRFFFCPLATLQYVRVAYTSLSNVDIVGFRNDWTTAATNTSEFNGTCAPHLTLLLLSYNNIKRLTSRGFDLLPQLRVLDLSVNGMYSLDEDAFAGLKFLKVLDLSDNFLSTIPENTFMHTPQLSEIDLANNPQLNFSSGFAKHFTNLQRLYLPNTGMESLSSDVFRGLPIQSLMLYKNRLSHFEEAVFEPLIGEDDQNDTANGIVTCLPDVIGSFVYGNTTMTSLLAPEANITYPGLRYLSLNYNNFSDVPPIKILLNLLVFHITNNQIEALDDDDFINIRRLQRLDLSKNFIKSINKRVFRTLTCMKELYIKNNLVRSIEETAFDNCQNLVKIHLQYNQIQNISRIFLNLSNLEELDLSFNHIQLLPYGSFPSSVKSLKLASNLIHTLSDHWYHNQLKMEILDLSNNQLPFVTQSSFPVSLNKLLLHNNTIRDIGPCTFCNMGNIINVTLYQNRLTTMDSNWMKVNVLKSAVQPRIYLADNPFNCDCHLGHFIIDMYDRGYFSIDKFNSLECKEQISKQNSKQKVKYINSIPQDELLCRERNYTTTTDGMPRMLPESCVVSHDYSWKITFTDCSNQNLSVFPRRIPLETSRLYLDGNAFHFISENALKGLSNLELLCLNDSGITVIKDGAFMSLNKLKILHLEENKLKSLSSSLFEGLQNLEELYLSSNDLKLIDGRTFQPLKNLKILRLSRNKLVSFPVWKLTTLNNLKNVSLSDNPWSCECDYIRQYRNWLQGYISKVEDSHELVCQLEDNYISLIAFNGTHCHNADNAFLHSEYFSLMVVLLTILLIVIIVGAVLYGYRRELQVLIYSRYGIRFYREAINASDRDKVYDAFISYSSEDEEFVMLELVPMLENFDPPFSLCIHQRDFLVGGVITDSILQAVESSRRTIMVLSENFVKSEFCRFEFKSAYLQMLKDRCSRVIVILFGKIPHNLDPEMKLYLKTNTYITWGEKLFWKRVCFAMPDKSK